MIRMTVFITLLVLSAAIAHAEPATPDGEGFKHRIEPHTFEAASGERTEAELGSFVVPENRMAETSRPIRLTYVRFPATGKTPGPPIVYLAGGPGGSGIGAARGSRFPLFQALRAHGDVIAFDQRGTGRSEGSLRCVEPYMARFDQPLDRAAASEAMRLAALACAKRLAAEGVDLEGYTSRQSADDLDALRQVLGADKLTLWGISYGTHLALATLRAHPDRIERLILAGIEGLDQTWKLPSDQQRLMVEIARLAASDPAVGPRIPDLLATVRDLLASLEEAPKTVSVTDPRSGMEVSIALGPDDLRYVLSGMLRGPETFAVMPDLVSRLSAGDWIALALGSAGARMGRAPNAMSVAMDCASGAGPERRRRIAREARTTLLADAINLPYPELCQGLPVSDLGDAFRAPARSDVPALLISGTLDGRTPPSNAEAIMPGLPNAQHLVIEGAGHSDPLFLSSPKILETMEAFLRGAPLPTTRIVLPPPRFVAPRTVVALEEAQLDRLVGVYQIAEGDVRRVFRAGSLLFTRRGEGQPLPIRPTSETTFFYEGDATHLRFDLDGEGGVAGMTMFADGQGDGEPAKRIE